MIREQPKDKITELTDKIELLTFSVEVLSDSIDKLAAVLQEKTEQRTAKK